MHSRTIESMRLTANGVDANWVLEEEWLDVYTVRRTAETMIDPFVWRWGSRYPPPESWRWPIETQKVQASHREYQTFDIES